MTNPIMRFRWARRGVISTRDFLNDILWKTLLIGLPIPWLFSRLGSAGAFASYDEECRHLVQKLRLIWPALGARYELIEQALGPGHASSFVVLHLVLWIWPIAAIVIAFREYLTRRGEIQPTTGRELLVLAILVAAVPLTLFTSGTDPGLNPVTRFNADTWGAFYFVEYAYFVVFAGALTYLAFLLTRPLIDRLSSMDTATMRPTTTNPTSSGETIAGNSRNG